MFSRSNNWSLAQREILLCAKQSLKNLQILCQHVSFLIYLYVILLTLLRLEFLSAYSDLVNLV